MATSDESYVVGLSDKQRSCPSPIPKGSCQACGYKLHPNDKHRKCYKCLRGLHDMNNCGHCKKLSKSAFYRRRRAQDTFREKGAWPSTLEEAVHKDSSSTGSFKTALPEIPKSGSKPPEEVSPWDEAVLRGLRTC